MKRGIIFLLGLSFFLVPAAAFAQEVLYGTTSFGSSSALYVINPATGTGTLVGSLVDASANAYAVTGLAFDTANGTLYGSTSNSSPTALKNLVSINPATGLVTLIGSFGTSGANTMGDLTFDSTTGTLYGAGTVTTDLYSINITTGVATDVGPSGLSTPGRGVGLAASSSGTIWGTPEGANQMLVIYNKGTGGATSVTTLSGAPYSSSVDFGPDSINALAFNATGTLYGVNVDLNDTTRPTHLITINTSNGAISDVGLSVNFLDAIVFVPEAGSTILFSAGLAILAFIGFRRR